MAQQTQDQTRSVEHEITVQATAGDVYRLIAEVRNWPQIFPPTIHVEHLGGDGGRERIRIWATANGQAKSWTSRRELDQAAGRIDFRQEVSSAPVAAMGGAWIIEPAGVGWSRVRLLHDYRAVGDDPAELAWIDQAVDRNSRTELAAMKDAVELAVAGDRLLSFEDSVHIDGSVADVYDFLRQAGRWQERLPHVASVTCEEDDGGLQVLEMDTRAKDGSTHTTKSFRVCLPPGRIYYKQVTLPPLLSLHTGHWTVEPVGDGVRATSQHTVLINPDRIAGIPGAGTTLAEAKDFARGVLGANSRATLGHAKEYAERRAT
ncbi:aromatase/cyclase [Actinoplanes sp. NBRC 103695]|uniref:aromatase/cyclase n=1 Tax=Actinoplanes sp. NBRC 103695 TaxID=3032202 RepID=UPI0024A5C194|nr:aromatase/cyclase [Actinoplanes sp. NBRC 103695]GLZ00723.1 actinorhodin polyketide synthase bifunctional cyclase/dehydratase [Actinoplanes sp. NBRC 103695]